MVEHAVIVHFGAFGPELAPLFELEDRLIAAILRHHVGRYDGNELAVDGHDGYLYMYGPDADRLFEVVRPILEAHTLTIGARVLLRYGPPEPGARELIVVLTAN